MKNTLFTLTIASLLLISCGDDNTPDIVINNTDNSVTNNTTNPGANNPDAPKTIELKGAQSKDLTIKAKDQNYLKGALVMEAGTTLTIEPGAIIKASAAGSDIYIAIAQGAKIVAEGTKDKPIIMTSDSNAPKAGDWGGLILLGKAPINSVASGTATSEIGSLPYGGTDKADNSGTIKYVRVQYSGGKADGQSENNGITFYGVGNGTTVEYIQVFEGLDDGVEFFGGTVNVKYVSVINADDDSIDWTEGYSGNISDVYVKQVGQAKGVDYDKAFECDGYNTDIGNNSNPVFWSNPTVTNVTIEGAGSDKGNEAFRLRAGTQGTFKNMLVKGFATGFKIDDKGNATANPTGKAVLDKTLKVIDITFEDVTTILKNSTKETFTEADFITGKGKGTGTDYATWGAGWTVK